MEPKEEKLLTDAKQNVENLRNELAKHQLAGTEPPTSLLVELKMAELIVKLESTDTIKFKPIQVTQTSGFRLQVAIPAVKPTKDVKKLDMIYN